MRGDFEQVVRALRRFKTRGSNAGEASFAGEASLTPRASTLNASTLNASTLNTSMLNTSMLNASVASGISVVREPEARRHGLRLWRSALKRAWRWKGRGGALDGLVLLTIAFYQRHLSPRKGYRCAHSVLHGGDGCSGAIYRAVEEFGALRAAPVARQRFRQCHLAAQILRAQGGDDLGNDGSGSGRRARNQGAKSGDCYDYCDFNPCLWFDFTNCCPGDAACSHASAHAAPCDCASCDASACDCSPCDCNPFN